MTLTNQDSLSSWLEYIAGIHVSAIDMGFERVLPVAKRLGILKQDLTHSPYVFTVAGTNGKGSTTATIARICQSAGHKTALYQSPHLVSFTERIKIDDMDIDEPTLVRALASVEQVRLECGLSLSFFEMTTLASLIFKEARADVWVLEIGLGGRLDVVNIIDPDLAVITNIGIDHVDWLGDDIEVIGAEKAGIIRPNIPVVLGARQLPKSVLSIAKDKQAQVSQLGVDYEFIDSGDAWQYSSQGVTLDLPKPKLSLLNAVNAVNAVLMSPLKIHEQALRQGLAQVALAGRFDERIIEGKRWLFDVAHNAHGMEFLLEQFVPYWQAHQSQYPNARLHIIFSMLGDKDMGAVLDLIQAQLDKHSFAVSCWHIAVIDHARAMPLADIVALAKTHLVAADIQTYQDLAVASGEVMRQAQDDDLVLVFGSFHTVSEVLVALFGKNY